MALLRRNFSCEWEKTLLYVVEGVFFSDSKKRQYSMKKNMCIIICISVISFFLSVTMTSHTPLEAAVIGDDYPLSSSDGRLGGSWGKNYQIGNTLDKWGMYNRECVSFAAFRLEKVNGITVGWSVIAKDWMAHAWDDRAKEMGKKVDMNPAVGSIAWWDSWAHGSSSGGHVAWVAEVNGNNVTVEDYNWSVRGGYGRRTIDKNKVSGYLHFKDIEANELAPSVKPSVKYSCHVQSIGWQNEVRDGSLSGTTGQAKRLEGITIRLDGMDSSLGGVRYSTHLQSIGWQGFKENGALSGTTGQSRRLEAIKIELTGDPARNFDIYYRVHAQSFGWMGWAKNGQEAGTAGFAYRLEGIEIRLVPKGEAAPGSSANAFRQK